MEVKPGSVGIENAKKLFEGVADAAKLSISVFSDGKIGFGDLFTLFSGISKLAPLAAINYSALPAEFKDLTKEEILELIDILAKKVIG